jgi:ABC-type nitrate/sulfonate/bicarbonate transport system substrate-binding protein
VSAVALAACGSDTKAAGATATHSAGVEQADVKAAVFPSFNALGAQVALQDNLFKEAKLNTELVTVATPAEAMPQLLGGKIQFALMDMTTPIVAKTKGVPLVMVAPGAMGTAPEGTMGVGNFWVRPDSKITSIKDIQNATFGIPQINSQIWVDIRAAVDKAGGDSSKIKFVEVPNTLAALKAGNVDVVTTSEPAGTAALSDPTVKLLSGYTGAGGDVAYAFVTTQQFAKQNPGTVAAFRDAILKGNKASNASQDKRVAVAATYIKADQAILGKAKYPKFSEEPISAKSVQTAIDRVVKYGLLEKSKAPKPADLLVSGK